MPSLMKASVTTPTAIPPPGERGRRGPRLDVLDGLRLLAALMVMLFHFAGALPTLGEDVPLLGRVAPYGWLGVHLFFLVSGFVICMSAWDKPLTGFVQSRVVRLLPTYVFCVLVTSAVLLIPGAPVPWGRPTPSQILSNLTMLQHPLGVQEIDHSYWTLWSELRFYLLFAVISCLGVTTRRVLTFCWGWTLAAVLAPQAHLPLLDLLANPQYAPLFISGIALYLLRHGGPRQIQPWALLVLNWFLMQHNMIGISKTFGQAAGPRLSWTVCTLVLTLFYAVILAVALGCFDRVTCRVLNTAGAISYPLYLIHQAIGLTLLARWRDDLPAPVLFTALGVLFVTTAWLIHRWVERPVTDLLRRRLSDARSRPECATHHVRPRR